MTLKPQDVVVLLKLAVHPNAEWTYQRLAVELVISQSEVHAAVRRAVAAKLMSNTTASGRPVRAALLEFLVHGVKYAFPAKRGEFTRGMPTAHAAPPLNKSIVANPNEPPPVWPYAEGATRGYALAPLYPTVPQAAAKDAPLYESLALVDAIRDGRARERNLATKELESRLQAVRA